ncbi:MAG: PEP/pyruvate-binding domain-containing protein, partial [Chloroflexota bacterium]
MPEDRKAVVWFNEVGKHDIPLVGGKGANLGEMTNAGIPVPPGFIVTATAYYDFIEKSGVTDKILALLKPLNTHDSKQLQGIALKIQKLIKDALMPAETARQIGAAYIKMGKGLVAVRSSATAEDLPEASFAGQQATFLNVQGEQEVVTAVQGCWASLFEARAIFYRQEQGFEHFKVGIAVPVQRMVQSEISGVMFTVEPNTSNKETITIEAVLGLGEMIVSGDVTPDHYTVNKKEMRIIEKDIKRQEWKLIRQAVRGKADNVKVNLTDEEQAKQKLSDADIIFLAKIGKRLEDHYQFPQDIEWAKENSTIYIVQTRPVTTTQKAAKTLHDIDATVLVTGAPASPGVASGPVKIVRDPSNIDIVMEDDILVAEMTTPDFVPAMKRAAAIVT